MRTFPLKPPPTNLMMLRRRHDDAAEQPMPLLPERAIGHQNRHRPRPTRQSRQGFLESRHVARLKQPLDRDFVDIPRRLARNDEPGPDLPQLDLVRDLEDAAE